MSTRTLFLFILAFYSTNLTYTADIVSAQQAVSSVTRYLRFLRYAFRPCPAHKELEHRCVVARPHAMTQNNYSRVLIVATS